MTSVILSPFAKRLLTIIIFLFIPLSIAAPHGVVWEVVVGGCVSLYYSRKQPLKEIPKTLIVVLFMIPLWGFATILWAKYPLTSLLMSLKIAALVFLGIYWCRLALSLSPADGKFLIQALLGGLCVGICFLVLDAGLGNPWQIFWQKTSAKALAQGSLMISLATWPAILWVLQRPYAFSSRLSLLACLLFSIFWTLLHIDCDTSFIGLAMGICVFLGTLWLPRIAAWGMQLFIPLFILLFPLISLHAFKPDQMPFYNSYIHSSSYLDRLYIWNETATTILEHPWRGIGIDGTRDHEKTKSFRDWAYINENGKLQKNQTPRFSMHPHNAILQLWLELGFPGVILGTLLAYLALFHIYRTDWPPQEKAVCAGLFMGTFVIVWVNLGFWQNWWISGLWIIIGLTLAMLKGRREANEKNFYQ